MRHSDYSISDDSLSIGIGWKHRHTIRLPRPMSRVELHRIMEGIQGVRRRRSASIVGNEIRAALLADFNGRR